MSWKSKPAGGGTGTVFAAPSDVLEIGDVASEGIAPTALRSDAVLAFPAGPSPADIAAAAADGASSAPARANHVHRLPAGLVTPAMLSFDPLARAGHTGTQLAATISDFAETARDTIGNALVAGANTSIVVNDGADTITIDFAAGAVTTEQIQDITGALLGAGAGLTVTYDDAGNALTINIAGLGVTNAMLAGGIALGKLATDPLARANHTGTQLAATISDFATAFTTQYGLQHAVIRKTADESVTNSTTLQNDDALTFVGGANQTWLLTYVLFITSPEAADFAFDMTVPAGATFRIGVMGLAPGDTGADATGDGVFTNRSGSGGLEVGTSGTSMPVLAVVRAVVVNAGTAGAVALKWAQKTADAGATTVLTNSFLLIDRV
jgi:hypothetical protein